MKPGGGKRRKGRGGPPPARRTPPPEATGAEMDYLVGKREKEVLMVVELLDGRSLEGVIRYFDRDMIKLEGASGPGCVIRKRDIRQMHPAADD